MLKKLDHVFHVNGYYHHSESVTVTTKEFLFFFLEGFRNDKYNGGYNDTSCGYCVNSTMVA